MKYWRELNINRQNIKYQTEHAIFIACPHNSDYDGYYFWHALRISKWSFDNSPIKIIYANDFVFKLKKIGKHGAVLDEVQIGYDELEYIFAAMNSNNTVNQYETHKPAVLTPESVTIDNDLIDE